MNITPTLRMQTYAKLPESLKEVYSSEATCQKNEAIFVTYNLTESQLSSYMDAIGDTILGFYETKDLPALLVQEVGVSTEVAGKIVADLAEFLTPVLERERAELIAAGGSPGNVAAMKEMIKSQQATPIAPTTTVAEAEMRTPIDTSALEQARATPSAPPTPATPLAHAPETPPTETSTPDTPSEPINPHNIEPMRTMSNDIKRAHGYGAYRDEHPEQLVDGEPVYHSQQAGVLRKEPPLVTTPKVSDSQ